MQVIETKNEGLTRQFSVALAATELREKLDVRLGELARTVKLPGFRPGKVPVAVVRKRFGASVKSEVLEQTISETSQAVITDRQLRPAGRPKLAISSYEDEGDLEYTLAVELLPEIVPPDYARIKLERMVAEVPEADVEKVLEHLARSKRAFADASEARPSRDGDIIVVDFVGPEDRKAFLGEQGTDVNIEVGEGAPLPGLGEQLVGLSVGDRRTITITFPADSPMASLAGHAANYEIEVKGLQEAAPVPIDDQLAQDMHLENLETLKAEIRKQRTQELKSMARLRLKRALLDRLAELYAFDLPSSLVEREYESIVRQMSAENQSAAADPTHEHVSTTTMPSTSTSMITGTPPTITFTTKPAAMTTSTARARARARRRGSESERGAEDGVPDAGRTACAPRSRAGGDRPQQRTAGDTRRAEPGDDDRSPAFFRPGTNGARLLPQACRGARSPGGADPGGQGRRFRPGDGGGHRTAGAHRGTVARPG